MIRTAYRGGLLCVVALVAATILVSVGINADQAPKKLRVLYTNDMIGYVEPCG